MTSQNQAILANIHRDLNTFKVICDLPMQIDQINDNEFLFCHAFIPKEIADWLYGDCKWRFKIWTDMYGISPVLIFDDINGSMEFKLRFL